MGLVPCGTTFEAAKTRAKEICPLCGGRKGSKDPKRQNFQMPGMVHTHTDEESSYYEPCPKCFENDPGAVSRGARKASGLIYGTAVPAHNIHILEWLH